MKINNTIIIILFFGIFMFLAIAVNAQVQNISSSDLSKIHVDQLSDDQIRTMMKKADLSGMTQDQIEVAAKSKGMPNSEIQKLKVRIKKLAISQTTTEDKATEQKENNENLLDSITNANNKRNEKIFGFSLFTNKSLSFEPSSNIATPMNYQLGPGDKFVIDIWGASQETYKSTVTSEGNIIISNVGPIYISGMTIEDATVKIKKELSTIYSGLLTGNTFIKISLSAARSIKVNIVGDVAVPGTYNLSSLSTVFNAMYLAGGPAYNGSLRDVKIIRNNKTVAELDFYNFLLKGELPDNMRLQDEDVVFVSTYNKRVEINGQIKRPALFDIKPKETLKDLIYFAGGFTDKAYSEWIKIYRKTGKEYKVVDVSSLQRDTFNLNNGDSIMVDTILNRFENRVEITGAVFRPGVFALDSLMTLKQLIAKAEGLRGDAFKNRISIYRTLEDLTLKIIPLNLADSLNSYNFILKKEDIINISSIFDIQEEYNLNIEGEVKNTGKYPYKLNTTVEDLIIQAGGLLESASYAHLEVARRIKDNTIEKTTDLVAGIYQFSISKDLKLSDSASKFILEPFDQIFIRKSPAYSAQKLVKIEGEVLFPGFYSITTKNDRVSDLIKRSGNLTPEAYINGARLIRQISSEKKLQLKDLEQLKLRVSDSTKKIESNINITGSMISINLEKIMKNPGSGNDLLLAEGDVLVIPKEPQTIGLSGALLYPVTVRYMKGYGVRKYISSSGGLTDEAKPSKIYVVNTNGSVKRTHRILFFRKYPHVEPGAEIVVPQKTERKRMTTAEAVGFGTAMSSAALIIISIINALK